MEITITYNNNLDVYIDVYDTPLAQKWLKNLSELITDERHLEKNYCFVGFDGFDQDPQGTGRHVNYIYAQIEKSKQAILQYNRIWEKKGLKPYWMNDYPFTKAIIHDDHTLDKEATNWLHRWFEDLQGTSQNLSKYYINADDETRWHIRQLNLLCHELEVYMISYRKRFTAPEWQRPAQLMCYINAPRFELTNEDFDSFGFEALDRELGGVYLGVNKAVGKTHYEVFNDEEGRNVDELICSAMRPQTLASGEFDIDWGKTLNAETNENRKKHLEAFKQWLINNDFDPEDKALTLGHPKVGQVNIRKSFRTEDPQVIWRMLLMNLNVTSIEIEHGPSTAYNYHWSDADYKEQQIDALNR